jgi:hypothetical protein
VLPGLWAGLLLCIALIAAPSAFAVLPREQAGALVARVFMFEAWLSLGLAAVLLMVERASARRGGLFTHDAVVGQRMLLWVPLLCTLLGYFVVTWLMPAARSGQGPFGFGELHAASMVCYAVKTLLVLALAWRVQQVA